MNNTPPEGSVLLIDKPYQWTSFDVVKKLRYALKVKKIGHAGTLDPLATGLLILCTGKMTKQIETFQAQEKEYTGKFYLGKTTPSYDLETEVDSETSIDHLHEQEIHEATIPFTGIIEQTPPIFSAIKVNGKRAYEGARKGEDVKLKSRKVEIKAFEITSIDLPEVSFRIVCSKGTYIRSIAHDFGQALGVGAHLSELRRTRIGDFSVDDAKTIEEAIS
ncbi:tRNA pseudouridine(55) synthase TruB [Fulvivirga sediminis]|uniref:tRNA pseudouridine synthase B n=1 Tax=Fulvivirga sediminis TaxID=2803949 RepID=A0A937FC55_9BACT|nr:tRNA pseudouridine(55) synthase TruB [Fulvivirga sediminis]MBL3658484.1 tRNA pseudouridine(55) synthase TruB [Fulvivirga sediminis]